MTTTEMKISDIKPNPNNPRLIKDEKFKRLVESVKTFPEMLRLRPIVVNEAMVIIGGNMRWKAAKEAGYKTVPVTKAVGLTEEQEREFIIKDNVGFGEWDWEMLANEWESDKLEEWGVDLPDMDVKVLDAEEDDYEVPDEIKTDIVLGDLFQIGSHRLLCGDSTDADAVARLMNGEKADMVFTDPPYNVAYGSNKNPIWGSKWNGNTKDGVILNDKKENDEWIKFCKDIAATLHIITTGPIYSCHTPGPDGMKMTLAFIEQKIHWSSTIILYKDRLVPGRSDYQKIYEGCFYGWCEGTKIKHLQDRTQTDVWQYKRPSVNDVHPTMKPIELIDKAIKHHSHIKSIADIFLGSGSTMVAAHQLGRKCYGMELDPKYCQVIVDRMHKLDPSLEIKRNGQPYKIEN